MKVLVSLIIFASIAASHQEAFDAVIDYYAGLIETIKDGCRKESTVTSEVADKMLYHGRFVEKKPLMCYLKCIYLKLQILNEAGEIHVENMKNTVGVSDKTMIEKVYHKCKDATGADTCEIAFRLARCTYFTVKNLVKDL